MNARKPFKPSAEEKARAAQPIDKVVSPTGYLIEKGMEVTLGQKPGRSKGRYEITRLEREASGKIVLTVYGPLRSRHIPNIRYINPSDIEVTHVKTRGQ